MKSSKNAVSDAAISLAEDAVGAAIDVASDVVNDASDLAADLALPVIAYGTKKLMKTRIAVVTLLALGAAAGLFAWKRNKDTSER